MILLFNVYSSRNVYVYGKSKTFRPKCILTKMEKFQVWFKIKIADETVHITHSHISESAYYTICLVTRQKEKEMCQEQIKKKQHLLTFS